MCFALDTNEIQWPRERHPDAVVIGFVGGRSVVCFVELKGNTEDIEKAFLQLKNGVLHFCDGELDSLGRREGTRHHDEWRGHDDIEGLQVDAHHVVVGVFVPRGRVAPRKPKFLSTKKKVARIGVAFVARGPRNRQEITFEGLVEQLVPPMA